MNTSGWAQSQTGSEHKLVRKERIHLEEDWKEIYEFIKIMIYMTGCREFSISDIELSNQIPDSRMGFVSAEFMGGFTFEIFCAINLIIAS